ncbi:CD48 antigen-like [Labeo rohita]|uniref:CD48 antigen-like n=1 Tax=Labeo rohita TaxID=84645 RepID=UPI0021E1C088|nr:CD48 antigen-like [Labeo rohita]
MGSNYNSSHCVFSSFFPFLEFFICDNGNKSLRFLLCLLTFKTGFSAEISVVVQTGNSVQLDIQAQELPEFDDLSWKYDQTKYIVKYLNKSKEVKLYPSYKDRVEFNNKTFSLTLKNMQKTDSGLYRAITAAESDNNIVTYRVSVIDTVEAPVLTVNLNWISGSNCPVNFTCRAHELMINSSYQNNRCSKEEVTHEINTLILDCSEESIICNHSNPVSWKEDRINILQLCDHEGAQEEVAEGSTVYVQVEGWNQTLQGCGPQELSLKPLVYTKGISKHIIELN